MEHQNHSPLIEDTSEHPNLYKSVRQA